MECNIKHSICCYLCCIYSVFNRSFWVAIKNVKTKYERFQILPFDSNAHIYDKDCYLEIDEIGCEFSLKSEYGIEKINVYKYDCSRLAFDEEKERTKTLVKSYSNLKTDELFIKCDLGEVVPTTQIEIIRSDYTIVLFELYTSGKDGHIITSDYKYILTIKSFLYYLCI